MNKFKSINGESIEELIKRYIELYWEMVRLKITKTNEEWVNKLANVLPGDMWKTYLLKNENLNFKRIVMQKQLMKQNSNLRKMFERKRSRLKRFQLSRWRRKLKL
ncbi:hypothetical protein HanHA300_Chr02g0056961 [Helianthus annuus]|nr:hypothetical protein HanHA300_Chr02g0056961 [Helianthus annuus]KAJ0618919.1 hypothetical protein HanHA89_Chr02g0065471 [Helianthus annuus]KAJ0777373.1 hypothetical protein HanLR1_Chr02g0059731 [Helianthus annuus]